MRLLAGHAESRLSSRLIAVTGRVIVIWLAVAIVTSAHRPLDATGLLAVSIATAVWVLTLRTAFAGAPQALGASVPSGIGAATGLVCVAALNPFHVGLHLSLPWLLALTAGILASSMAWEAVLARMIGTRRVLVIGSSAIEDVAAMPTPGGRLSFEVFDAPGATPTQLPAPASATPPEHSATAVVPAEDLALVVATHRPDLVVLTDDESCAYALDRLLEIRHPGFRVAGLTSFYEYAFGCVPLPRLTPLWFMGLLHFRQPPERPSKRVFDVIVASIALAALAPVIAVLAMLIKRTPGPVFYRQTRVGERGRLFRIYKLRTMSDGAERPGEAIWAHDGDPRITGIGTFLRGSHLDELPQLWNVLRGDMSIVGPRPERPEFIEMLETSVPFWSRRLLIRPGLTGWAQIRCGYAADESSSAEKLAYDFWYLRHGNLVVDVAVCLRTIVLMLLAPRRARIGRHASRDRVLP